MQPGIVLSVAGSDPSGGAGIQADLKTFTRLGVYGGAVMTCLTVQNTAAVKDALMLDPAFVKAQLDAVLDDLSVQYIKTGMLGNAAIAAAVGQSLRGIYTVCDPVMISKSGFPLMQEQGMEAVEGEVITRAKVLTPNYHELMRLCHRNGISALEAGEELMGLYPGLEGVVVKGGHIDEAALTITDTLIYRTGAGLAHHSVQHPRVPTRNTHGTGCTLSSAITSYLALGEPLPQAFEKAVKFIAYLIEKAGHITIGHGNGPLLHYLFGEI